MKRTDSDQELRLAIKNKIDEIVTDDKMILYIQEIVYVACAIVSISMTIMNYFTNEFPLFYVTLIFATLCILNVTLSIFNEKYNYIASWLFVIEVPLMFAFFIITGHPDGFSILWAPLIPFIGLLLFENFQGLFATIAVLIMLIIFFWIPGGSTLLRYDYGETFRMRFPMLYLAAFMVAIIMDLVITRMRTVLKEMAIHDPLTKTFNRAGFKEYFRDSTTGTINWTGERSEKNDTASEKKTVGFIIMDLDRFKDANDTYGHDVGDQVLVWMTEKLKAVSKYPICRWGGEEFAIFVNDGEVTKRLAEHIRAALDYEDFVSADEGIRFHQTVSLGAIETKLHGNETLDDLCEYADRCLYEAKESGRNKVVFRQVDITFQHDSDAKTPD